MRIRAATMSESERRVESTDDGPDPDRPADEGEIDRPDARAYPWWAWREEFDGLSEEARPLAEAIGRAVEGEADPEDAAGELVARSDVSLEQAWTAADRLYRSLDRARDEAPEEELEAARDRLHEVVREVWIAGGRREGATFRDFVREVAHDLRSPLHSILFLTDGLYREESGPLTPVQKRQISVVHTAAAALLRMANDVLDFSSADGELGADEVDVVPVAAQQVVGDLESHVEPLVHHHRASLEVEADPEAGDARRGDPQVLKRILLTLTSNGLEAAGEDGTVRVRMEGDGERLRAVVEDDAGDVEPEELERLIEGGPHASVVRRLDGDTRGLGLVICVGAAGAADGDVAVRRTDDGWTRVSVTLPFPVFEPEEEEGRERGE